ncbi:DUF221-domain-containing protein [Schizophyllum commune H4-8]|uniref:DUF221-domain-containing protein n=1 Tax=Schizophyllum commune (strain H4-8 / FGSC 9210) TaxID=578458 RepID=UPI0021603402|nr:DUF221-domain-containing protein [Schizophyllum commune H4-8]KAI5886540.1 DUF221-domain-containing protein [Schizophyllum commune H4-8]
MASAAYTLAAKAAHMLLVPLDAFATANALGEGEDPTLPPGSPPTRTFEGPWFQTQLTISCALGFSSFIIFSYCRTRWPILFAPRTKLKGFSPHEAHEAPGPTVPSAAHPFAWLFAPFAWIGPTIRTSEYTVLQIVGLDAAVLLSFFKMCFYLFASASVFAVAVLMPINFQNNKDLLDDGDDGDPNDDWPYLLPKRAILPSTTVPPNSTNGTVPGRDWLDLISDANSYLSAHLVFTYLFTALALFFIRRNYRRFIRARQLFSLELVHSIPARTVLVTRLPQHLKSERALAEYFEAMDLSVESVSLVREVGSLKRLLDARTEALLRLERAWVRYVGNPSAVEEYDPEAAEGAQLVDVEDGSEVDLEANGGFRNYDAATSNERRRFVVPHRPRPTLRPRWFALRRCACLPFPVPWLAPKVDALEYLESDFRALDDEFKKRRRNGRFKATETAFVTFEKMSSAQVAIQVAHAPAPLQTVTKPAPEPRDIVWSNMTPSQRSIMTRDTVVMALMGLLLFFWVIPTSALASLLSYKEIKKTIPWLARLIDRNETIEAIVQNSLPSAAIITLNALLPFLLEALTYAQGYRARSWIEYSLLKKYFLFLLINVVFIFLLASTYLQLVMDLANSPAKIPEKVAQALHAGKARHFFLSYVILQSLGIMPLQLLNLGVVIPRILMRIFVTRTPRDFAELNAPPLINYGVVYPQAILIFVVTLLYSVTQPLIVVFGALYFGIGYVVYKYKLLFVFYKPYESRGQAWPITFIRLIWGVVIFQIFMVGFFLLKKAYIISTIMVPLLGFTVVWTWWVDRTLAPLSKFVSLSSVCEVERGEETADVVRLRAGHPVTWSQSNLNRRRYAQNDDTLYVAPEDERTDYSQPPMANWYAGVLNTGKRRYGHPALNGVLPEPWLPLKKGQTLVNSQHLHKDATGNGEPAVVLSLRKRASVVHRRRSAAAPDLLSGEAANGEPRDDANPWQQESPARPSQRRARTAPAPLHHRLSFDQATGVINLPDDESWLVGGLEGEEAAAAEDEEDVDSDEDYGTVQHIVVHNPSRRTSLMGQGRQGSVGPQRVASGSQPRPRTFSGQGLLDRQVLDVPARQLDAGMRNSGIVGSLGSVAEVGGGGGEGGGAIQLGGEDVLGGGESVVGEGSVAGDSVVGEEGTPSRTSRYGTYFHHPERRRLQIPGAFPGR